MPDIIQVQPGGQIGTDNDPEWPRVAYGPGSVPRRSSRASVIIPWQALALLLGFLLIAAAFGYWRYDSYCGRYDDPCWWHGPALSSALVLIPLAGLFAWLWGFAQERQARAIAAQLEAEREGLIKDRYGETEPLWMYQRPDVLAYIAARHAATLRLEEAIAPHKRYSGVETLNEGAHTEVHTDLGAPLELPAPIAPQLPAGPLLLGLRQKAHRSGEHILVGFSEGDEPVYLRWGTAGPSAVAGGSGSGKTSTIRLMAAWHALNGGALVVLDPHGKKDEGLIKTIDALSSSFLFEPAIGEEAILRTLRAADRLMRRRIHGEESAAVPVMLIFDEFTSACRNFKSAPEIVNLLLNFGDEYRGVNGQALIAGHHWRGDILDPRLGGALRSAIHTRIVHRIAPAEAKFLLTSKESQGIDRLPTGEGLFFDGVDDALRFRVPFLDDRALAEAAYPQHAGWPLPTTIAAPADVDPLAELRRVAAGAVEHFGGDRERAAVALLMARGTAVRGRYAYRVRDVARVLNLKDEVAARCAALAGRNGSE
jgi:hypothetical protein